MFGTPRSRSISAARRKSRFRVGRSKTGLGLFAAVVIRPGAYIVDYVGRRVRSAVAGRMNTKYLFELDDTWTIDGSSRRNVARYINHACRPNAEVRQVGQSLKVFALKRILPGDEITYDYGEEYFDAFIRSLPCRCASCVEKGAARATPRRSA